MLESLSSALAEISLPQLALIAGMALVASFVGGVAGYGTGALMPLVLVPIVGTEPVVPILSLSALLTNSSRATAFWGFVDGRRALMVLIAAVPTCVLGAWGYTMLSGKGAALVIGAMLVISIGIGFAKLATFGLAGVVSAQVIAIALLIGAVAFPGAFLAKRLIERLPLHVHTAILDAVVTGGGAAMMVHAFAR